MSTMSFNTDFNKQAAKVAFSRTMRKSYHSQTCFSYMLGISLTAKLNVIRHILVKNVQVSARFRKLFVLLYIRLENVVYGNHLFGFFQI